LRAALPKGNVRRYDIFSIFPFENYVVIVDILGSDLLDLFNSMASRSVEALSYNVLVEVKDKILKDVLIEGQQIDITKKYRIATIDFLLGGGDNLSALSKATNVENTGVLLRDAILKMIEKRSDSGIKLTSSITNRVRYE
jgi:2',3'-cyclic-nucleotide 2'-phosphodiesterase (5'-nucleotidase family)